MLAHTHTPFSSGTNTIAIQNDTHTNATIVMALLLRYMCIIAPNKKGAKEQPL
jgi:hypothetical protein